MENNVISIVCIAVAVLLLGYLFYTLIRPEKF
ncbi:MAG: K(+)-transporting ATPase subunit F [Bacteroidota bacterium]